MNKTLKWILIGAGVLLGVMIIIKVAAGPSDNAVKVTVETAQKRTIIETVSASGQIYPELEVKLSPDVPGEITELNVEEGDSVRKGQVLARVYSDIFSDQRNQAASQVNASQATVSNAQAAMEAQKAQMDADKLALDRNRKLYEDKIISKGELEQFETRYRTSQAQYNAARENIRSLQANVQGARTQLQMQSRNVARTVITAPMDGVITTLRVKKGERVVGTAQMAGTEMMTVADLSAMEVRVEVGENDIVKVNVGDSADVKVDAYNERKFKGVVTKIGNSTATGSIPGAASNNAIQYAVHIRLDPSSYQDLMAGGKKKFPFRPGMNANAEIKTTRVENALSVPTMSVVARIKGSDETIDDKKKEKKKEDEESSDVVVAEDESEVVVFVLKADNTVEKRVVTTGIQDVNYFEIRSGLKEGEKVVSAPYNAISKTLKTGNKVKVVSREELVDDK
jgi:HlyD family secretion protein